MPLFYFAFDGPGGLPDDLGIEFPNEAEATAAAALALAEQARDVIRGTDDRELSIDIFDAEMTLIAKTRLVLSVERFG